MRMRPRLLSAREGWRGTAFLIGMTFLLGPVFARPPRDEARTTWKYQTDVQAASIERLKAVHGASATVEFAAPSSLAARRISGLAGQPYLGSPEAAATAFRTECSDLVPAVTDSALISSQPIRGLTVLRYQRTWQGLPIFGAVEVFHVDSANRIRFYASEGGQGAAIDTTAAVGRSQAEETALTVLPAGPAWRILDARVGIIPPARGRRAFLAWQIDAVSEDPVAARSVYVDAQGGAVLTQRNRLIELNQGKAYLENPATGPLATVDLQPIDTSGTLRGPYASVMDWVRTPEYEFPVGRMGARADLNGDFFFSAGDERTAEVNVYYHMNRTRAFFGDLGFHGLDRPFPAVVNVELCDLWGWGIPDECDNAYFHPLYEFGGYMGGLFFGKPSRGNYGLDGDVVSHEYVHGVVAETADLGNVPYWEDAFEALALNEAFADYFSCAINGDPAVGEYASGIAGWSDPADGLRNLDNDHIYPDDIASDPHSTGLIWSGACWELRSHLAAVDSQQGRARADRLVFATLVSLSPLTELTEAGPAMVAAAQVLEDPPTVDVARRILFRRGLLTTGVDRYRAVVAGQKLTGMADPVSVATLSVPQYTIDLGAEAGTLKVHIEATGNVDLFARYGRPVSVDQTGGIIADNAAATAGGTEDLEVSRRSTPAIQTGRYYVAIANRTDKDASYTITFTVDAAPPEPNTVTLESAVAVSGQLPGGPILNGTQYLMVVAAAAGKRLNAALQGTGELDLYVRREIAVERNGEGQIIADARSTLTGAAEQILLDDHRPPGLADDTYYVAIANQGRERADFTLLVTIEDAPAVIDTVEPLTSGQAVAGTADTGGGVLWTTQYEIAVPVEATVLEVRLLAADAGDIDLYARFDTPVAVNDGVVADHSSAVRGSGEEFLTIDGSSVPPLRAGTYYLAVVNQAAGAVPYTITAETRTDTAQVTLVTLTSGTPVTGQATSAAEPGTGLVDNEVYQIEVPAGSPGLRIALEAIPTTKDLDLAVRRGAPPEAPDGRWIADYVSGGPGGSEEVYIPAAELVPGTYFAAIANFEAETMGYRITAALGDGSLDIIPGIPQSGTIGAAPTGYTVIDITQYCVDVPDTTVALCVQLSAPTRPDADIDLYLRFGQRVEPSGNTLLTDYRSESNLPIESILVPAGTVRRGTYYIAVGNVSPMPVEYVIRVVMIPQGQEIVQPLADVQDFLGYVGPAAAGGLAHYPIQFTFDAAADLESVTFALECLGNADLYVRRGRPVEFKGINVTADFAATVPGDSTERITIDRFTTPPISSGTYFLAVTTREQASILFLLTPLTGFFTNIPLTSGTPEPGQINGAIGAGYATVSTTQFTIEVPPGTETLTVTLNGQGNGDIDLFARYGANVFIEGVALMYDHASTGATGRETLTVRRPTLRGGTYYFTVINKALFPINYTIQATLSGVPDDKVPPSIECPKNIVKVGTGFLSEPVQFQLTATDSIDPAPKVWSDPPSGSRFPYGTTEVFVFARDWYGNESSCTFTVTIRDMSPPEVTCPGDLTVAGNGSAAGTPVEFSIAVLDNADPDPRVTATPSSGSLFPVGTTEVFAVVEDSSGNTSECRFRVTVTENSIVFRRGNANADDRINIADAVFTLGYLFAFAKAPPCLDAADANDDGKVNIADAVAILGYLFRSAGDLPAPFAQCGVDPTADDVTCEARSCNE